jgi:hypothetical protein
MSKEKTIKTSLAVVINGAQPFKLPQGTTLEQAIEHVSSVIKSSDLKGDINNPLQFETKKWVWGGYKPTTLNNYSKLNLKKNQTKTFEKELVSFYSLYEDFEVRIVELTTISNVQEVSINKPTKQINKNSKKVTVNKNQITKYDIAELKSKIETSSLTEDQQVTALKLLELALEDLENGGTQYPKMYRKAKYAFEHPPKPKPTNTESDNGAGAYWGKKFVYATIGTGLFALLLIVNNANAPAEYKRDVGNQMAHYLPKIFIAILFWEVSLLVFNVLMLAVYGRSAAKGLKGLSSFFFKSE